MWILKFQRKATTATEGRTGRIIHQEQSSESLVNSASIHQPLCYCASHGLPLLVRDGIMKGRMVDRVLLSYLLHQMLTRFFLQRAATYTQSVFI